MTFFKKAAAFLLSITIIFTCAACHLYVDGKPLTTEELRSRLADRYGEGNFVVKQIDSDNWEVSLPQYPGITYTVSNTISNAGVIAIPHHSLEENRMEKLGSFLAPKYLTADELKGVTYSSGYSGGDMRIEIKSNFSDEDKINDLQNRIEQLCRDMRDNYPEIAKDTDLSFVVNMEDEYSKQEKSQSIESPKMTIKKSEAVDNKDISEYLDSAYGKGNWNYTESQVFKGEYYVSLKEYPDIAFSLNITNSSFGTKKIITDDRYRDVQDALREKFADAVPNARFSLVPKERACRASVIVYLDNDDTVPNLVDFYKETKAFIKQYTGLIYADNLKNQPNEIPLLSVSVAISL